MTLLKVEIECYAEIIKMTAAIASQVPVNAAAELVNQAAREETIMPFVDPTKYIHHGEVMRRNVAFMRAFHAFRKALAELEGEGDGG